MERRKQQVGEQSIQLEHPVYLESWASLVGKKEGEGPLGGLFDRIEEDDTFGQKTWEEAESAMQLHVAKMAMEKIRLAKEDIRMIFAGDLLAQSMASSFGIGALERPTYGLFGACSTMGEALELGSMAVAGGFGEWVLTVTSSHFATAEKEFRFPLGYGSQRPLSAGWTVTGSGAVILGREKSEVQITGFTTGKITDFGLKDTQNMGACMAPAACRTIACHFRDFACGPEHYDKIITGDLGSIGHKILYDLLKDEGYETRGRLEDCGVLIYDPETQDTHAGGSGCGCSASVLTAFVLPKLASGEWKRVLFVPTGALMSKVSSFEGNTVPGIAQAVVLESVRKG